MQRSSLFSRIVLSTVVAAAALGAESAQARPEASVSIVLPGPPVFLRPPVLLPPSVVFERRGPAFAPPPVVYEREGRYAHRIDFERERAWRQAEWQRREWKSREWQRREWDRRHDDGFPSHGRGRD